MGQPVGPGMYVRWDACTLDDQGGPISNIEHYEVALSSALSDLTTGDAYLGTSLVVFATDPREVTIEDLVASAGASAVGNYRVWVRAVNDTGTPGTWSPLTPLDISLDLSVPGETPNVRVE